MNVHLSPRAEKAIASLVASGRFADAEEAIEAAAVALSIEWAPDDAWIEANRDALAAGLADAADGRTVDGPPTIEALRARLTVRPL